MTSEYGLRPNVYVGKGSWGVAPGYGESRPSAKPFLSASRSGAEGGFEDVSAITAKSRMEFFSLNYWDYFAVGAFSVVLGVIGYWAGRGEQSTSSEYFLAGKKLPWYVVGGSFIASNISSEHFIGMIGSAMIFGGCVVLYEWGNLVVFSLLIWFFIPFLLASGVFTMPEFLERRFSSSVRTMFALVTVISNVVAFLAGVLYGGALALQSLFGWDLWFAIIALALVAGVWAIYGGLSSVAWTDLLTVAVMLVGGITVTLLCLEYLAGEEAGVLEGFNEMLTRNQATTGPWREANLAVAANTTGTPSYNRLSIIQPATHPLIPTLSLPFVVLSVSIWYNVLNQFMIQRVLGAKDMYHARMGIIFAGWIKVILPLVTVVPGLCLFALFPELLLGPWEEVRPEADRGYVNLIQKLVPQGLRGLFLAALFGAIQSTINSVLNSTATIFTLDIYQRHLVPDASDRHLVRVGVVSSCVILAIAIVLGRYVGQLGGSLFEYIQSLYAFFAPPFAAVFLLGILWRRINVYGAWAAILLGLGLGVALKLYVQLDPTHPAWLDPFGNQTAISWIASVVVCVVVSFATPSPPAHKVGSDVTFDWKSLGIFTSHGRPWYASVSFWWSLWFVVLVVLIGMFSDLKFPMPPS